MVLRICCLLLFICSALGLRVYALEPREQALMETTNERLHKDTLRKGKKAFLSVGERLPAFALIDQNGDLFEGRSLLGHYTVVNFVFTRCTVPTMCPAATKRMVALQQAASDQGLESFRLVTISFDPKFDTPEVLSNYAEGFGVDASNYALLTGPEQAIANLMKQLGVLVFDDEALIYKHTMQTTLIGPDGKLLYRIPGSMWRPVDFLRKIEAHQEATP